MTKNFTHAEITKAFRDPYMALILEVILSAKKDEDVGFINSGALDRWVSMYNLGCSSAEQIDPEMIRKSVNKFWGYDESTADEV